MTKKYQRDKLGVVPCYRSTLLGVLMLKAWRRGYLEMGKLEDKMLYRWSGYILLLLVAQQVKLMHDEAVKIVPGGAIIALCGFEIRSILLSFAIGGSAWATESLQILDDIPRKYLPQALHKILSVLVGYGSYPMQPPTNQQRPPPITGQKPMLGQPPEDNSREGD